MKKKLIIFCLLMIIMIPCVKGEIEDNATGSSTNLSSLGSGGWASTRVAIKVSIVDSTGEPKETKIFTDNQGLYYEENSTKYYFNCSNDTRPKTKQNENISWVSCGSEHIKNITLTSDYFQLTKWWDSNEKSYRLDTHLEEADYYRLKGLLANFDSLGVGDFILVEPMTLIGQVFATAFEFANKYDLNYGCGTSTTFCYKYSGAVFGGSKKRSAGGIFYTTIALAYDEPALSLVKYSDSKYTSDNRVARNNCLKSKTCGRGIGVYRYTDVYDSNNLKIKKVDGNGNKITSGYAYFNIYNNNNCSGTPIEGGTNVGVLGEKNLNELPVGTYSIKEVSAPSGYNISNECQVVNVPTESEVVFVNTSVSTCSSELTALKNSGALSAQNLFDLYIKYSEYNYNGLLDLSNPRCEYVSCTSNPINITGCLAATSDFSYAEDSNFNSTAPNLSCFDLIDADNNHIFCNSTAYSLTNNFPVSKFYGKNGNFLIKKDSSNSYIYYNSNFEKQSISSAKGIATAKRVNVCYSLNPLTSEEINNYVELDVTDFEKLYFGMNDYTGYTDNLNTNGYDSHLYNLSGTLKRYRYTYYVDYDFLPFYFKKITGEYRNIRTKWTTGEKVYGLLSKFNDENEGEIPFQLGNLKPLTEEQKCWYELKPEIIVENKLQLEFRTIDTSSPFNRNTKSNWCYGSSCDENNSTVQTYITNRTNSYGFKNGSTERQQPIWKITLTPNDIKLIREYNKDHPYDNYNMHCSKYDYDNDGVQEVGCRNAFLGNLHSSVAELKQYSEGSDSGVGNIKLSKIEKSYGSISSFEIFHNIDTFSTYYEIS